MAVALAWPADWQIVHHAAIDSTNLEARRLIEAGTAPAVPFVIWADEQLSGRGRMERQWVSPPGNVYASLVIKPRCAPSRAAELGFAAALAVRDTAIRFLPAGTDITLKWPNDVLVEGGKVSGILLEGAGQAASGSAYVIAGIGINVAFAPDVAEARFVPRALGEFAEAPPVGEVLIALADAYGGWVARWRAEGFAPLRAAWLAGCGHVGAEIEVRLGGDTLRGVFSGLGEDGTLILQTAAGDRRISAGDVYPRLAGGTWE